MEARVNSTDNSSVEEERREECSVQIEKDEARGGKGVGQLKEEEPECEDVRLDHPLERGCKEESYDVATGCEETSNDDTSDELRAMLDLYQQALEDLRVFALRRSLNKHFDGDQEVRWFSPSGIFFVIMRIRMPLVYDE